jgi:hypothetical protein
MARALAGTAFAALLAFASAANAGHHQWIISELYSNPDGTIQFVELLGTANNEQGIGPFTVNTFGSIPTSVPLAPNLPSSATAGKYVLIGTAGYATLAAAQGAPAPDRVLPNNFLEIAADTVRYAGLAGTDIVYTNLPSGGVDSLDLENPSGTVNTPQNFAGATGSIDATPDAVPAIGGVPQILLGLLIVGSGAYLALRRRATA